MALRSSTANIMSFAFSERSAFAFRFIVSKQHGVARDRLAGVTEVTSIDAFARNDLLFTMSDNTRTRAIQLLTACGNRVCEFQFHGRALGAWRHPRWWSQTGSNRRPPACKAGALPAELWPRARWRSLSNQVREWWAWEDLNFRPHAYQARALTN